MYADPSRRLYSTFGLTQNLETTPAGQEKRSYLGKSFIGNVMSSIWVRSYIASPSRMRSKVANRSRVCR